MGSLVSGLTKHGVADASGNTSYYNNAGEAAIAAARQSVAPTSTVSLRDSELGMPNYVPDLQQPEVGPEQAPFQVPGHDSIQSREVMGEARVPRLFQPRPTLQEAQQKPEMLTRKGHILGMLLAAPQALADAASNGAFSAKSPGEGFGLAFNGVQQGPRSRKLFDLGVKEREQEAALRQQEIAQRPVLFKSAQEARQAQIERDRAAADASRAVAGQREMTPEEKYAANVQAAERLGLVKDSPQWNKVIFGDTLREPNKPQPTRAGLALEAAKGDPLAALNILTQESIKRARATQKDGGSGPGGLTAAEMRLLNADSQLVGLRSRLHSLLKEQGNPLSMAENLPEQIDAVQKAMDERVATVLAGGGATGRTGAPLTKAEAVRYLEANGGDPVKAREAAKRDGRTF